MELGIVSFSRDGNKLAEIKRVSKTTTGLERMKGLLGTKGLDTDQAMWLDACNSIHMFFMSYALDVIYLDRQQQICRLQSSLKPWRASFCLKASSVIELASGQIEQMGLTVGDQIHWEKT